MADTASPGTVLITGTTSGVGLQASRALVERGWTVITANRDPVRAAAAAEGLGIAERSPAPSAHGSGRSRQRAQRR